MNFKGPSSEPSLIHICSCPCSLKSSGVSKPVATRSNQNGSGPPPGNGLLKSTPSSTDDMDSALLKSPTESAPATAGMFGKFDGFTLRPLNDATTPSGNYSGPNVAFVQPTVQQDAGAPQRAAPPPPATKTPSSPKPETTYVRPAPALPPPNPGSTARPIISPPKLDSSTLTMVPLKGSTDDLSARSGSVPPPPVPLHADPKLNMKRDGTIRRLTSFLKKDEKPPLKEKTYIDRERLRTLEISAPMPVPAAPQTESSNSDSETTPREEETQNLVKRAQSMRSPTKKAPLQSFGSMRSPPGLPRPKSGQVNNSNGTSRPKSPPPRPPPVVVKKTNSITSASGYQRPVSTAQRSVENTYDDCEFVERETRASNDDIYSVIDEIPPAAQTLKRSDLVANRTSNGSDMGLLNEIVNELEKINGESVYSGKPVAVGAAAPPADAPKSPQRPAPPKPASSVLEEKAAVAASTYHRPAAVNAPVARVKPTVADKSAPPPSMSSFKPPAGTGGQPMAPVALHQAKRSSGGSITGGGNYPASRPKSFVKSTSKTLPNGTGATSAPSATIQKPKPLSAKPSFSGGAAGGIPGKRLNGTTAPTPPTVKTTAAPKSSIASLAQRFEQNK